MQKNKVTEKPLGLGQKDTFKGYMLYCAMHIYVKMEMLVLKYIELALEKQQIFNVCLLIVYLHTNI